LTEKEQQIPVDPEEMDKRVGQSHTAKDIDSPQEPSSNLNISIKLPLGKRIRITVESSSQSNSWNSSGTSIKGLVQTWPFSLQNTLFGFSLVIYLLTRLIGLSSYPIYFFSDEAVQSVLAADLVSQNFKSAEGELFPSYFQNVDKYSLSATVYIQLLSYLLFGQSVFITRLTSVLLTLLAAVCIGLILRDIFKLPYWWSGTLLLSIVPAWFLHSRTAFETVAMVAFYTGALYFYLLYRYRSPRYLYISLVLAALAFYSYSPGQLIVIATALLLVLSDFRYHWQNRATLLRGLGLVILLALPYFRFRLSHPDAIEGHLYAVGSYWLQPLSLSAKLGRYFSEYIAGLNPVYWFISNKIDLARHKMNGYGHLLGIMLPFAILGLFLVLKGFHSSKYRVVFIALICAPAGAALAHIAVTRALVMVIPLTLLVAIGLNKALIWLEDRHFSRVILSLGLFLLLAFANIYMLRDALQNGPTWEMNYGLGGMQYGAAQVFGAVEDYQGENPDVQIIFSPAWANGPDILARFFLSDPIPIQLGSIVGYLHHQLPLEANTVFVMTPEEYSQTTTSGKFKHIRVVRTVLYPNSEPGFYFVHLEYVDNIAEILAAEMENRRQLLEKEVRIGDNLIKTRHSMLDIGSISDIWDGDKNTVARTFEANPFIIELTFPQPRLLSGISMIIGDTKVRISAKLYLSPHLEPVEYTAELQGSVEHPEVSMDFDGARIMKILYLEVEDLLQVEPGHVHIWEINFH
jgi:4-amino-4-deoxy-L-arabinose transferase-like glycosyltransferase